MKPAIELVSLFAAILGRFARLVYPPLVVGRLLT